MSLRVKNLRYNYASQSRYTEDFNQNLTRRGLLIRQRTRYLPNRDLEKILFGGKRSGNHADEVWPNLFLGDMSVANDRFSLWKMAITHVLNAAHGKMHCQGSHEFYGSALQYHGVPADDSPSFNLAPYFHPCADYIEEVLSSGGRVLVHCAVGVSRSAALVLAYLMIQQRLSLMEAISTVQQRRWIFPNRGFLRQLRALDGTLRGRNPNIIQCVREELAKENYCNST